MRLVEQAIVCVEKLGGLTAISNPRQHAVSCIRIIVDVIRIDFWVPAELPPR